MPIKPAVLQWTTAIICGLLGIAIYITAKLSGNQETWPQGVGKCEVFVSYFNDRNSTRNYIDTITRAFQSATTGIKIHSRIFNASDLSHPIIANLTDILLNKNIPIKFIVSNKTDTSQKFFKTEGLQYRVLSPDNEIATHIVSDFIIIDNTEYIQLSNLFETSNFSTTNLIGVRIADRTVVEDALRIFRVNWAFLTPEESKRIPPISIYWPFDLMPLTYKGKEVKLSDNTTVLLTAPSAKYNIPHRQLIKPTFEELFSSLHNSEIMISSSYFEMLSNSFVQDALVSAVWQGCQVKLLISRNHNFQTSLYSAGLIAPFSNITVRVGPENSNFANYMIIDDTLYFVSESVTGRVFQNTFGIGLLVKGKTITQEVKNLFKSEFEVNTTSFTDFASEVYGSSKNSSF